LVCGIAGLWVTWLLGRRIGGDLGGLTAATLVAISPWHLYTSGFARYYAFLYLLAAAALLVLLTAYETDQRRHYLAALGLLLLGSATHPSFLFPLPGIVLGLALVTADGRLGWRWPSRAAWQWLWGPYAAALVLAIVVLKLTGNEGAVRNWGGRGLVASARLLPAIVQWMTPTRFVAAAAGAVAAAAQRDARVRRWGWAAALGAAGTLAVILAASFRTNVYADYATPMLPLVFVSAGVLVALAAAPLPRPGLSAAIATLVLAAGVLPSTVSHLLDGTRFDYRPAYARIAADAPQVAVLAEPIILQRHYAPALRGLALRPRGAYLDSTLARERDLWAVIAMQRYGIVGDRGDTLRDWLAGHCRAVAAFERPRLDYRRYRVELHRCQTGNAG
jgi:hypothetical protein